ncbi:unnamed protein product [Spodoptera exigua]|nr:unnamed protein product [Spodoptera exigua]
MGCMLRSDPMTLCGMYLQPEVAFDVLAELGELGCVQFIDMYPELQLFQRNFVMEVCRYAEMERRLQIIAHEMKLNDIPMLETTAESVAQPVYEMVQFENMIEKWEEDIQEMTANEVTLLKSYFELTEFHYVLTYINSLLGDSEIRKETLFTSAQQAQQMGGDVGASRLIVITGVVRRTRCYAFEMMLWRISHGIVYYRQSSNDKILIDPQTRKEIRKVAFLAICQGEALSVRVQKICTGFQVNTFPCPNTQKERIEVIDKLETRITDLDQEKVQSNVPSFTSSIETTEMPPTFHRTNKFTRGFQNLINAYGDSTYRELNPADQERNTSCAPQILLLFIDMVLMSETKPANEGCKESYMFENQRLLQTCLVFAALLCVPVLLLGTPIYKLTTNKKKRIKAIAALKAYKSSYEEQDPKTVERLQADVEKYSEAVGELMIHQGVHTIEFVLSTISHTASYLRLWALSLAHAQLSEMLWGMVLSKLALQTHSIDGAVKLVIIFALWATFTLSILVVMEGLSAFLHCLRLHWVEFMSKFYAGGGWPFRPYSFNAILDAESDKTEAGCKSMVVQ